MALVAFDNTILSVLLFPDTTCARARTPRQWIEPESAWRVWCRNLRRQASRF
jgi:hypothetical protein